MALSGTAGRVRIHGPLEEYVPGFEAVLLRSGVRASAFPEKRVHLDPRQITQVNARTLEPAAQMSDQMLLVRCAGPAAAGNCLPAGASRRHACSTHQTVPRR